ncbi:hypothetical protein Cni_G09750 [Canna indica]|uniref:Uncharacterized protein n=1 Tax=Canna indica TaxID=4628 RepID=A0AAQ3K691_9LILI|nr:hypothetical protein Cni_G09750 [Canna indica]
MEMERKAEAADGLSTSLAWDDFYDDLDEDMQVILQLATIEPEPGCSYSHEYCRLRRDHSLMAVCSWDDDYDLNAEDDQGVIDRLMELRQPEDSLPKWDEYDDDDEIILNLGQNFENLSPDSDHPTTAEDNRGQNSKNLCHVSTEDRPEEDEDMATLLPAMIIHEQPECSYAKDEAILRAHLCPPLIWEDTYSSKEWVEPFFFEEGEGSSGKNFKIPIPEPKNWLDAEARRKGKYPARQILRTVYDPGG